MILRRQRRQRCRNEQPSVWCITGQKRLLEAIINWPVATCRFVSHCLSEVRSRVRSSQIGSHRARARLGKSRQEPCCSLLRARANIEHQTCLSTPYYSSCFLPLLALTFLGLGLFGVWGLAGAGGVTFKNIIN